MKIDIECSKISGGKSELAKFLYRNILNSVVYREPMNEFILTNMYHDIENNIKPSRAATILQNWIIDRKFKESKQADMLNQEGKIIIKYRGDYSDSAFAYILNKQGFISDIDYVRYKKYRSQLENLYILPDLVIRLDVDTDIALKRIKLRGRPMEQKITKNILICWMKLIL